MTSRLPYATADLDRARDMVGLGQAIQSMTIGRVDATDMYRAALVQAVSAMDHYFHGVVIDRAAEIMLGRRPPGVSRGKVGIPFSGVSEIIMATTPIDQEIAARAHAAQRLALETLQRPDSIAEALGLVGIAKVWSRAFGVNSVSKKTTLGLIVSRRNRIVHQSDADPLLPGTYTPLSDSDALDAVAAVREAVTAIDGLC